MVRRSLLFTPGDEPSMLRKAPTAGADVVVFDLEDGVSPKRKSAARETVAEVIGDPDFDPDPEVWVRVNPSPEALEADVDALAGVGPDGPVPDAVVLPKVGSSSDVDRLARLLEDRGIGTAIVPLVETGAGVLSAPEIADVELVDALCFGAEDYAADVGASRTSEGTEVLYGRERVVASAAAAGVDAIDTIYSDFGDEAGLRAETRFARQLGFDGKFAIHPAQVGPINEAFAPDPEEVEWARRVLAAREERGGDGAFQVDGEMIDPPLIARAERFVALADEGAED